MQSQWHAAIISISIFFCAQGNSFYRSFIPFEYTLLKTAKKMYTQSTTTRSNTGENNTTSSSMFFDLFLGSLEDGFFGGIQLGIAACFYQILYEFSSRGINTVVSTGQAAQRVCTALFNKVTKRPPAIDLRTLAVLTQLLGDTIDDFEETVSKAESNPACREMHKNLVRTMCMHIIAYFNTHYAHYTDTPAQRRWLVKCAHTMSSHDMQEVAFTIQLIVQNLTFIVEQLDNSTCYREVARSTRASVRAIGRLSTLLSNTHTTSFGSTLNTWFGD